MDSVAHAEAIVARESLIPDLVEDPDSWLIVLDSWTRFMGTFPVTEAAFPHGMAHWLIPATSSKVLVADSMEGRSMEVTFIRGYVSAASDFSSGWSYGRGIQDGLPFRTVTFRFSCTGGAGIVRSQKCPLWLREGWMPEVPFVLSRRLALMFDAWRIENGLSVSDVAEVEVNEESDSDESSCSEDGTDKEVMECSEVS